MDQDLLDMQYYIVTEVTTSDLQNMKKKNILKKIQIVKFTQNSVNKIEK